MTRFTCTGGGAVQRGRERLRGFLLALGLLSFAVAGAAWFFAKVPAFLAVAAGALALYARRMSADLDPLWLGIEDETLIVQMRRQRHGVPLGGTAARLLDPEETAHLTRLATTAGITVGTGGFDSHRLGELDLFASDLDHAVIIHGEESSTVVTPDDPGGFLAAVEAAAGGAGDPAT